LEIEADSSSGYLAIGSAVLRVSDDGCGYIPIINFLPIPVSIKRGQHIAWCTVSSNPELFIQVTTDSSEEKTLHKQRSSKRETRGGAVHSKTAAADEVYAIGTPRMSNARDQEAGDRAVRRDTATADEVNAIGTQAESNRRDRKKREYDSGLDERISKAINESECPEALIPKVKNLLRKYSHVLADTDEATGLCTVFKPRILLNTDDPVYTAQYPIPFRSRELIQKMVEEFMDMGVIRKSTSPYNSPALIVPKPKGGWRLVVDFRKLNKSIVTDPFPLPRIGQIMETLGKAKYFTALDLLHGFYNLEIDERDCGKTAFSTHQGHFEFCRLPMGLKNSPAIFQRLMGMVLEGSLGIYSYIYIDDILVFSSSAEKHCEHLEDILKRLSEAGLRIKFNKSQLFRTELEYLGFLIGKEGIKVNPRKLLAISNFPVPKDVKGVQAFLGLIGYFRTFVVQFAERARPLYDLLKKEVKWTWTGSQQAAFDDLKDCMLHAPILAFPDFDKSFILTTDASAYALGAILTQVQNGQEVLISCASRTLKDSERNYSNVDREMLAVIYGVLQNKSYLYGNHFIIRTDNSAITHLARQVKSDNRRAVNWHLILSEYNYELVHRKGSLIAHADALSRYPSSCVQDDVELPNLFNAYLSPGFQHGEYEPIFDEAGWRSILCKLKDEEKPRGELWETDDGLVYLKSQEGKPRRLWVPPELQQYCLRIFHDPPAVGHAGMDRMKKQMSRLVIWKGMMKDIEQYVSTCESCQKFKLHNSRTPYRSMPPAVNIFDEVSIDVVGPVPSSTWGLRYVLVDTDEATGLCTVFKPRILLNTDDPVYTAQYPIPFPAKRSAR
jgi:hypothetical protein